MELLGADTRRGLLIACGVGAFFLSMLLGEDNVPDSEATQGTLDTEVACVLCGTLLFCCLIVGEPWVRHLLEVQAEIRRKATVEVEQLAGGREQKAIRGGLAVSGGQSEWWWLCRMAGTCALNVCNLAWLYFSGTCSYSFFTMAVPIHATCIFMVCHEPSGTILFPILVVGAPLASSIRLPDSTSSPCLPWNELSGLTAAAVAGLQMGVTVVCIPGHIEYSLQRQAITVITSPVYHYLSFWSTVASHRDLVAGNMEGIMSSTVMGNGDGGSLAEGYALSLLVFLVVGVVASLVGLHLQHLWALVVVDQALEDSKEGRRRARPRAADSLRQAVLQPSF